MKNILIMTLAVIMIVSVFLPCLAFAANDYDIKLTLRHENKVWQYRLSENIKDLTQQQINGRAIYRSLRQKKICGDELLKNGYTYQQVLNYLFPNFAQVEKKLNAAINKKAQNASFAASVDGVQYTADKKGREVDYAKLYKLIFSGKTDIDVPTKEITADITLDQIKKVTKLRGKFYTGFSSSGSGRAHNIKKSVAAFNGLVVKNGQRVSFNEIVGPRTEENGYKTAKIILDGKYVDGVGGGVCQVSTTLYNALLLSDIKVVSRSRHSLVSGYILSGFDAMVNSSTADLIFENNTGADILICASAKDQKATFAIYGLENEYKIERLSVEKYRNPPEEKVIIDTEKKYYDKVKYDDEKFVLSYGSEQVETDAYLIYYKDGKEVKRKFLHTDKYMSSPMIIIKGAEKRPVDSD